MRASKDQIPYVATVYKRWPSGDAASLPALPRPSATTEHGSSVPGRSSVTHPTKARLPSERRRKASIPRTLCDLEVAYREPGPTARLAGVYSKSGDGTSAHPVGRRAKPAWMCVRPKQPIREKRPLGSTRNASIAWPMRVPTPFGRPAMKYRTLFAVAGSPTHSPATVSLAQPPYGLGPVPSSLGKPAQPSIFRLGPAELV